MSRVEGRMEGLPQWVQELLREMDDEIVRLRGYDAEGFGDPDGVVVGYKGATFRRRDGGAGTCFYVFEGTDGSTSGWVAK